MQLQHVEKEQKDKYTSLIEYYRNLGAKISNIKIIQDKLQYRRMVANQTIGKDSIIISIPKEHIITQAKARSSPIIKSLCQKQIRFKSSKIVLALYLLIQKKNKQTSQLFHYINCLPPASNAFPLKFDKKQLQYLKGTCFLKQLQQIRYGIKQNHSQIVKQLQTFTDLKIQLQQLQQMYMIVSSRTFGIQMEGKSTGLLVPIADMLNHSVSFPNKWFYDQKTKQFCIKNTIQQISQGQEIFISYGDKSNILNFLNYGFVTTENLKDTITLYLDHYQSQREKLEVVLRMNTGDYGSFILMAAHYRKYALQKLGYENNIKQPYCYYQRYSSQQLNLYYNKYIKVYFTEHIQIEMWNLIKHKMQQRLEQYPTTIQFDEQLASQELESNLKNCIQLRLGQKRILKYYIEFAENIVKYIKGQKQYKLNTNQYYFEWIKEKTFSDKP